MEAAKLKKLMPKHKTTPYQQNKYILCSDIFRVNEQNRTVKNWEEKICGTYLNADEVLIIYHNWKCIAH